MGTLPTCPRHHHILSSIYKQILREAKRKEIADLSPILRQKAFLKFLGILTLIPRLKASPTMVGLKVKMAIDIHLWKMRLDLNITST